jgi:3-isopropylmalate dehydrogenase
MLAATVLVAVLPGDGIGPEIVGEAVRALRAVRPDVELGEGAVGAASLRKGEPALPERTRALCDASDAILFGAVGDPAFAAAPFEERPEAALLALRRDYGLFANLRPVRDERRGIDLVVVRELTGGLYYGEPKGRRVNERGEREAVDTMRYTAPEIERIAHVAFSLARTRRGRVTSVDKCNVLETSRLWREVVAEVALAYPDVRVDHMLVDTAAMRLVRQPADFDVVLTENTFGDILSDEAAVLAGSIGVLPSASLGAPKGGRRFGLYEPIAGSAPDIAGRGIANPVGAILSAALLLRHSLNDEGGAACIEAAVETALNAGVKTFDLAAPGERPASTAEFGDAVVAAASDLRRLTLRLTHGARG